MPVGRPRGAVRIEFIEVVTLEVVVVQSGQRVYGGRTLPDETVLDRY